MKNKDECCDPSSGCCSPTSGQSRRDFIKLSAMAATILALPSMAFNAISQTKGGHLIPADKKLSAEWIKSLTARGVPEVFTASKDELKYIGMPVGGISCGQLYISGDGRLWLWDIFQSNYEREGPAIPEATDPHKKWRLDQFSMGGLYAKPRTSSTETDRFKVENGFAVRYMQNGEPKFITLDNHGFDTISFRGEYPVAKVTYKKEGIPFTASLNSYPIFIPLDVKDSSMPATVMTYEFTNEDSKDLTLDVGGWLENKVCPEVTDVAFERTNNVIKDNNKTTVFMTASGEGLSTRKGYGNMAISLLNDSKDMHAVASLRANDYKMEMFDKKGSNEERLDSNETLVGGLSTTIRLKPGESKKVTFLVSWYFPYYNEVSGSSIGKINGIDKLKRHYAKYFSDSNEVAQYIVNDFNRLSGTTLTWNKTWYDSTLPYWFLDRAFISLDCLASQTSHLFNNDRFWGWEGVDCCTGTCTHVWMYAQGLARIFPSIERDNRTRVDYGISLNNEGAISMRGENFDVFSKSAYAVDGQLGTIIRVYREHQVCADDSFLINIWPSVKKSMQFIIKQDEDGDGLLEGRQPHTLDAAWYGPMGWISSMYLAALKACEMMALEMNDPAFANTCNEIIPKGQKNIVDKLFNGEYFIHLPPDYESINTNDGCHIDQILGQSFAHQVNLPDVIPQRETKKALESLWKYNFAPDAGQYALDHEAIKGERTYVMPGEAGLMMTTWPLGGDDKAVPGMADRVDDKEFWIGPGGYFDECMNGFEYQVASHMVSEGMLTEGLSIMKSVHDRYNAAKRNPFDEVECSSHYARSMASYGVFIAACGYSYHGPKGELGFAPKINPENFKSPFTTAEGWGTFTQKVEKKEHSCTIALKYGQLRLKQFSLELFENRKPRKVAVSLNDEKLDYNFEQSGNKVTIEFKSDLMIKSSMVLKMEITLV
ncbi:GH116 family glycosyl hydrolase [Formosa sp. PL04]|uniref:GH116 family glycosyl hydrolase n=1 Tax=Formosa sp. PL04 TaxID=3081755 RepID=UPI002980ADD5|nr:GH116 family glycosyl hydrolase [Formosa sp. PL04]MDW5290142.1 GH116 family glycosyl hydrolase [Formosa sp. PL04]